MDGLLPFRKVAFYFSVSTLMDNSIGYVTILFSFYTCCRIIPYKFF